MVVPVPVRQAVQRAVSYKGGSRNDGQSSGGAGQDGRPTETTHLLNGSGSGRRRDNRSWVRRWLLDRRRTPGMDSEKKSVRYSALFFHTVKITLLSSPVNILLFFIPVGIVAGVREWDATAVFTLNFFAIIPLAAVLSFATEQISDRVGDAFGGLLNATFGNAVELIVSIVALRDGQIEVVQSSMLGSILSNLLLVMGMCFFLGGIYNMRDANGVPAEQQFASATAQTSCSLMALSSASLILPATLYGVLDRSNQDDQKESSVLILSRGTAIILLILYVTYLWFQLRTHPNLFNPEQSGELSSTPTSNAAAATTTTTQNGVSSTDADHDNEGQATGGGDGGEGGAGGEEAEEEEAEYHMSVPAAISLLVVVTILVSVCADYLVDSIDAIVAAGHISKNFIGLILIPIVGNAAEHVTACVVAVRNKMDLAMSVAIGSSIQIALLVTPFLVVLGWLVLDQPMSLHFETFETVAFALSVLVVTYTVQDGKSNYLEGAMLMGLYIIIALAFYASPSDALDKAMSIFSSSA